MEDECKIPCEYTTNHVQLVAEKPDAYHEHWITINLRFNKMVEVKKKIIAYDMFDFIIDAGSSLGLWLGLSALGIFDLFIDVYKLISIKFITE